MEKFTTMTSQVVPLPLKDIDTDMIIPACYMTSVSREGYGEHLFQRLRDEHHDFVLNDERFKGARILVADENFGCGSSREHAVWALMGWGFRVVIAKSFADIFAGNSGKNGLVLVPLADGLVDQIVRAAQTSNYKVTVDLEQQTVCLPNGEAVAFEYDPFRKHCVISGLDDIDYIQSHHDKIGEYRRLREDTLFGCFGN